ncbi:MAG: putative toxin-antitoxin system toxin component, PIN family [Nitrospirae bacterium]|nr:putative toxin-antitoxin system toxin component, PIN family [Nitrospirota bacterium]
MLVSAFVFGGIPERAIKKAFAEVNIYISSDILKEYREVPLELKAEGKISHPQLETLIAGIASFVANAKLIFPSKRLNLCRDEEDNMLLECCLEAKAGFLITGDKDLLEIKTLPFNLKILSPKEYLEHE